MPYSAEHKERSKNKLLASAFTLFAHQGYDAITIDTVTQHAGLTRGAFYNHFASKQELYREAMVWAAKNSKINQQLEQLPADNDILVTLIEGYLSKAHLSDNQPCPLGFLVTDMVNQEPEVRATYTHIFDGITQRITELIKQDKRRRRPLPEAQAVAALLIGGVAVSRALDDEKLTDQVMNACRELAIDTANRAKD